MYSLFLSRDIAGVGAYGDVALLADRDQCPEPWIINFPSLLFLAILLVAMYYFCLCMKQALKLLCSASCHFLGFYISKGTWPAEQGFQN